MKLVLGALAALLLIPLAPSSAAVGGAHCERLDAHVSNPPIEAGSCATALSTQRAPCDTNGGHAVNVVSLQPTVGDDRFRVTAHTECYRSDDLHRGRSISVVATHEQDHFSDSFAVSWYESWSETHQECVVELQTPEWAALPEDVRRRLCPARLGPPAVPAVGRLG